MGTAVEVMEVAMVEVETLVMVLGDVQGAGRLMSTLRIINNNCLLIDLT